MSWLLLGLICVLFAWMAVVVWRKWVAPWQQIEQLVARIRDRQRPSTFLVNGGTESKRVGLALENIFARQQELDRLEERRVGEECRFRWSPCHLKKKKN